MNALGSSSRRHICIGIALVYAVSLIGHMRVTLSGVQSVKATGLSELAFFSIMIVEFCAILYLSGDASEFGKILVSLGVALGIHSACITLYPSIQIIGAGLFSFRPPYLVVLVSVIALVFLMLVMVAVTLVASNSELNFKVLLRQVFSSSSWTACCSLALIVFVGVYWGRVYFQRYITASVVSQVVMPDHMFCGQNYTGVLLLRNRSDMPVQLLGVTSNCSCVSGASLGDALLQGNELRAFEVLIRPKESGTLQETLTV